MMVNEQLAFGSLGNILDSLRFATTVKNVA